MPDEVEAKTRAPILGCAATSATEPGGRSVGIQAAESKARKIEARFALTDSRPGSVPHPPRTVAIRDERKRRGLLEELDHARDDLIVDVVVHVVHFDAHDITVRIVLQSDVDVVLVMRQI